MGQILELMSGALAQAPGWMVALADASAKATVVLGAAWLATSLARRASASARHLVWSVAISGALLLPALSMLLPSWQVAALPAVERALRGREPAVALPSAPPAVAMLDEAPFAKLSQLQQLSQLSQLSRLAHARSPIAFAVPGALVLPSIPAPPAPPSLPPLPAPFTLQASAPSSSAAAGSAWPSADAFATPLFVWTGRLWILGVLLGLGYIGLGRFGVWRLARRARPVQRTGWLALAHRLAAQMGIRRPVALMESERAPLPMTFGVLRPVVLLPLEAEHWTMERLELVLLHELAHVRRLDALTQVLAQLACALYWFHPLAWIAERRMRALREYACDDRVLEAGNRASAYASEILEMVRALGQRDPFAGATLAMARKSQLEGRLVSILDPQLRRAGVGRLGATLVGLAALALLLPLAALQPSARAQTAPAPRGGPLPRLSASESESRRAPVSAEPSSAPFANAPVAPPAPPAAPLPPHARPGESDVCAIVGRSSTEISHHSNGQRAWHVMRRGQGCKLEANATGDVRLNADRSGVESMAPGASLVVTEQTDKRLRRLELRADEAGKLRQSWAIDGDRHGVREDSGAFIAGVFREIGPVPFFGGDAQAVREESRDRDEERDNGDSEEEEDDDEVATSNQIQKAVQAAKSEGELADRLDAIARHGSLDGEHTRELFIDAANRLHDDDLRAAALKTLLDDAPISRATAQRVLQSAAQIHSDGALLDVLGELHRIKESDLLDGPLAMDYINAVSSLGGEDSRAEALRALLHEHEVPADVTVRALQMAKGFHSDRTRLKVLIEVKDHQDVDDPRVAELYKDVASAIQNASKRQEAMDDLAEARDSDHRRGRDDARRARMDGIRMKIDAKRMAIELRTKAKEIREKVKKQLDDAHIDQKVDEAFQNLEDPDL